MLAQQGRQAGAAHRHQLDGHVQCQLLPQLAVLACELGQAGHRPLCRVGSQLQLQVRWHAGQLCCRLPHGPVGVSAGQHRLRGCVAQLQR